MRTQSKSTRIRTAARIYSRVTYRTYFSDDHKSELRKIAQERGLARLEALLEERDDLDARISELSDQLERVGFWSDGRGGGIFPSCWIEDEDPLVHEINSSGNEEIGSPSRIRTRVTRSRVSYDGPLHQGTGSARRRDGYFKKPEHSKWPLKRL